MKKNLIIALMASLALCGCGKKTVVDTHDMAMAVADRGLGIIDLGSYSGTCLYSGMADVMMASGLKEDEEKLLSYIDRLLSGDIPIPSWSNFICYNIGGQTTSFLAYKGWEKYKDIVAATAADMWENQYRTTDNLMTGNRTQARFKDGAWIDCAFAVSTFYLYAGLSTGNRDYVDYAAYYTLKMHEIFFDASSGMVFQARACGKLEEGEISQDNWARGEGWLSMALVALLRDYPADGQYRAQIEEVAKQHYTSALKYQDKNGMWHQELTNPDSYVETSGSALLIAGIGQAIESGILPQGKMKAFKKGLRGLMAYVDADGSVGHTCTGTLAPGYARKVDYEIRHYYYNEVHGFGPVVLALGQALRLGVDKFEIKGHPGSKNDLDRPRAYVKYADTRKGDIAWENAYSAYRVYSLDVPEKSQALSGVDMWPKDVDYSIIDKWYANEAAGKSYHIDHGEGCDFYAMGAGRGIGGTGVWADGKLWTSRNYASYEILENNPEHAAFKLGYEPYQAGEVTISESKLIEVVPFSFCYKVTATLTSSDGSDIIYAAGLTNFGKAEVCRDAEKAMLFLDEHLQVSDSTVLKNGTFEYETDPEISSLLFVDPAVLEGFETYGKDELVLMRVPSGASVTFYAGAVWGQQRVWGHSAANGDYLVKKRLGGMSWENCNEIYK
ncbi:MAG: glycoside hydrolase family 88 protein [Bacteroidales bacterium]|nr:glycoside hydrolase family 88 protein [Bacteroidales bacterium]